MSILGYDCNGRPLRAGDRVVLLSARHPRFEADIGRTFTVRSVCRDFSGSVCCDEVLGDGTPPEEYSLATHSTRRIDDRTDHQDGSPEKRGAGVTGSNKYQREIRPGVHVDVYSVLVAFGVTNPADAHAIKKMLMPGRRGVKDGIQDREEAIASLKRAIEIEREASQ